MSLFNMKSFVGFLSLVIWVHYTSEAQSLREKNGSEWIKPGQLYIKTKLARTGMYRVRATELAQAGLDVIGKNAEYLQILNFGKQIPVFVSSSGIMRENDYLEFYGEKLTVGLDSLLFDNWQNEMLNTEYSFVTDSNTYFITYDTTETGLRYILEEPDYDNNLPPVLPYYMHEEKNVFTDIFYKIQHGSLQYSNFEPAEGWAKQGLRETTTSFNLADYINVGVPAVMGARISSTIFFTQVVASINNKLVDTMTFDFATIRHPEYMIPPGDIQNTMTINLKNNFQQDLHRLAFAYIRYPRVLKCNTSSQFSCSFGNVSGRYLLPFSDFNTGGSGVFFYSPLTGKKIKAEIKNQGEAEVIADINPNQPCFLVNDTAGMFSGLKYEVFLAKSFENTGSDYLIITHKNLKAGAETYAQYRSGTPGGRYNVSILEMHDIYNHFGYGIDRHFYAIKNLSKYLRAAWTELNHVFLLGKGLSYTNMRSAEEVTKHDGIRFFVPGYGIPSSDNMLLSEGNLANPFFAVGRYAALSDEEIYNYLDKIKLYESAYDNRQSIEDKYWMKRVLHLSGGGVAAEQSAIRNNLLNMQGRLENSPLGSKVFTFYKTSTDQLASAALEEITNLINTGVNMITFFGHSAPGTWDFNLEDPSKYTNYGKYPFINSLGCYSGNIFGEKSETISEKFVKIKDRGAIGFLASGGTAFISQLGYFGYEKYGLMANELLGKSIGTILKTMADKYKDAKYDTYAFYQQLIMHGDPAIKMYHFDGPDFTFDYSSVKTKPDLINSSVDTIVFETDIYNLGMGIKDSLNVVFYHYLPDNSVFDTVFIKIPAPFSSQRISVNFKNAGVKGIGKNTIIATIDPFNEVAERPENEAKTNNNLISSSGQPFTFFILDNTAIPVEPCNYGIVNNPDIQLKASTSNALIQRGNYIFQIDTTRYFNSPLLQQQRVENVQGLLQWKPGMPLEAGLVYYWRVSPDSVSPENGYIWQNASFVFLPETGPGFNQSHYFQFTDNNKPNHIFISKERKFEFPFGEYLIDIVNGIFGNFIPGTVGYRFNFENPANSVRPWNFMPNGGVCFVLGNPITSGAVQNKGGDFGSIPGGGSSSRCFGFLTNTAAERKKVIDFLQFHIPDDYFVYFFTVMNSTSNDLKTEEWESDFAEFGTSIPQLLRNQGAVLIDSLIRKGSRPYTFMFRENKGVLNEGLLEDLSQTISTKSFLPYISTQSSIKIENIGPSSRWDKLEYTLNNVQASDTINFNIYGIRENKNIDTLYKNQSVSSLSLADIDANVYPYLQVELYFKDAITRSVPDVEYFRIFFNPLSDLALDPEVNYSFLSAKLNRGETLVASIALSNLSDQMVDSVEVKYTINNLEDNSEITEIKKAGPIPAKQHVNLDFRQKMLGKPGKHVFIVEANHNKAYAEKYYFNNIGKQEFELIPDKANPFLDVYFDGQKILDGDIVSAKPEIKLLLQDENSFLSLDNPELFSVKLDTGRNQIMEIPMSSPELTFEASAGPDQPAVLKYYPTFKSGDYKLIVQAKDASGNVAGANERVVSFRVIEEETVSHILNYPNPFSTSTQFVFTLTGTHVPEHFSIRIYTITGKLVREITRDELGPLRIGMNRTQFKWDGTDEFGQKLANGVYLYKAFIQNKSGETFKNNSSAKIDAAFQDGFGKMVILR